jgi:hypothetical protein
MQPAGAKFRTVGRVSNWPTRWQSDSESHGTTILPSVRNRPVIVLVRVGFPAAGLAVEERNILASRPVQKPIFGWAAPPGQSNLTLPAETYLPWPLN